MSAAMRARVRLERSYTKRGLSLAKTWAHKTRVCADIPDEMARRIDIHKEHLRAVTGLTFAHSKVVKALIELGLRFAETEMYPRRR